MMKFADQELQFAARHICDDIHGFVPDAWTETYELPTDPKIYIFARIFQAAAVLYALTSLPEELARAFCLDGTNGARNTRLHYRRILLNEIKKARSVPNGLSGMCWPVAVLGVSLFDAAPDEQAAVLGWLKNMEMLHTLGSAPVNLQELLAKFWASGKCGWEDCFPKLSQVAS